ncbi:MAG: hypothetical protein ACI8RD_004296 [Bacillariaceae sp.]|jgi:hypothetical protein
MAFYNSGDTVNAVVADLGSYATKIGYAGEDYPRSYFRSVRFHFNTIVIIDVVAVIILLP